jgi:hypothetical protein
MGPSNRRKPRPTGDRDTAKMQKQHTNITASWAIREAVSAITLGALFGVIFWSCVLGMSGNFGPGKGVVFGPIAENDHAK